MTKTRWLTACVDEPAPTVMAYGMCDVKYSQVMVEDDVAGRRLKIPADEPAPTVMAGGIGDVNCGQYTVIEKGGHVKQDKPDYRIPLMTEIAAAPRNGLVVVSTFSGCGGSCLGFKMAGYDVLWANEFVPAAQDTYRANHPATHLDTADIRTVTAASIRSVIGDREVDVLEGSPPCASFSTAGKTSKGWGEVRRYSDVEQRTDDLFEQYIRLVDELKPRAFVAENVSGMVKGVAKGHFLKYLAMLRALPYNVEAQLLDAQWLGVPQRRVRLIIVGVRKDVGKPIFPRKLAYSYSIREAIPWLGKATAKQHSKSDWQHPDDRMHVDKPSPAVLTDDSSGSFNGHQVEEVRVVAGGAAPSGQRNAPVDMEAPSPTVLSGGEGDKCQFFVEREPRVIYDEGFKDRPAADVTDGPSPTVKTGVNGLCSTHFIVEGAGAPDDDTKVSRKTFVEHDERYAGKPVRDVTDEPAPTIKCDRNATDLKVVDVTIEGSHGFDAHARRSVDEPSETITNRPLNIEERIVEPESALGNAVGAEWDKLKEGGQSAKYISLIKPDSGQPSPTVTALGGTSAASVAHPIERRKFTIAELRRICGFPDDFALTGSYAQQWERLGRAVPPPMMRAVAEALKDVLCAASSR